MPQPLSLNNIEYTTKTAGWVDNLVPYWRGMVERQEARVRLEEKNLREGKHSIVQYELGKLDGMIAAINVVESIKKVFRLNNRVSRTSEG